MSTCEVCFRHCHLSEGQLGFCGARICRNGTVTAANYGRITSIALDPIEKKPLNRFYPGSLILSIGSYGCNLRCPFCQNSEISWSEEALHPGRNGRRTTPRELADTAVRYRKNGNIGLAFTYNEPLVSYEFVRDTARLIHEEGMFNVLVTNGCASLAVLEELTPYIDAMNIDLKGFTEHYYGDVLKGNLAMVKDFIREAARICFWKPRMISARSVSVSARYSAPVRAPWALRGTEMLLWKASWLKLERKTIFPCRQVSTSSRSVTAPTLPPSS